MDVCVSPRRVLVVEDEALVRDLIVEALIEDGFEVHAVGNVNDEGSYRPVDGIFNAGVLYHLDDPVRCLERCAANARLFLYVDTGHVPRTDEEWRTVKLAPKIGRPYQITAPFLPSHVTHPMQFRGDAFAATA